MPECFWTCLWLQLLWQLVQCLWGSPPSAEEGDPIVMVMSITSSPAHAPAVATTDESCSDCFIGVGGGECSASGRAGCRSLWLMFEKDGKFEPEQNTSVGPPEDPVPDVLMMPELKGLDGGLASNNSRMAVLCSGKLEWS